MDDKVLEYATPRGREEPVGEEVGVVGFLWAVLGIFMNLVFQWSAVRSVHESLGVYKSLMQNPQAYGRTVSPALIATLRLPLRLWVSQASLVVAGAFGLLLAIHLLVACVRERRDPEGALRRFRQYDRWKRLGAIVTTVAFYWAGSEDFEFWTAATRHIPLGGGPPVITSTILLVLAWAPAWYVRRTIEGDA